MLAKPKCKDGAYWTHRERKESGGSDHKCFDHHTFYVGYNITSVSHGVIKAVKGIWELAPRKIFIITFPAMLENAPLRHFTGVRKIESMFFDLEETITIYQMIIIQGYGRTREGKIAELGGKTVPPCHPLASWVIMYIVEILECIGGGVIKEICE